MYEEKTGKRQVLKWEQNDRLKCDYHEKMEPKIIFSRVKENFLTRGRIDRGSCQYKKRKK